MLHAHVQNFYGRAADGQYIRKKVDRDRESQGHNGGRYATEKIIRPVLARKG